MVRSTPIMRLLFLAGVLRAGAVLGDESPVVSGSIREADSLYRAGQPDEALAAYDRAYDDAQAAGDSKTKFDAAYRAATVEHQRKRFALAAKRFRKLALEMPDHPQSASVHLMSIFDTAQIAREQRKTSPEYLELLNEHLEHWPRTSTAAQARIWLGALYESEGKWREAVSSYQAASTDSQKAAEAIAGAARTYGRLIATMRAGQSREEAASAAISWFEQFIVDAGGEHATTWGPALCDASLAAARLWVSEIPHGYMQAHDVVAKALQKAAAAPDSWRESMAILEVAVLAREGRVVQARTGMDKIKSSSSEDLRMLMDQLVLAADTATPDRRQELARLQLRTTELLLARAPQPASLQIKVAMLRAQAFLELDDRDQALSVIDRVLAAFPTNAEVREQSALLLAESSDVAARRKALGLWQELARRSKPGGARWFRANYGAAETYRLLGEAGRARQLVMGVQAAYPELGGPTMKPKFVALLKDGRKP